MEKTLSILPNIEAILSSKDSNEGVEWILDNIEVVGPHLNIKTLEALPRSENLYKCLSQIYFMNKNYDKAIENALNYNLRLEDNFFSKSIHFHMIEKYLTGERYARLTEYIENLSREACFIGFLIDSEKYELLQKILEPMEFLKILKFLEKKKGYELLLQYEIVHDKIFLRTYADAIVFLNQLEKIDTILNVVQPPLAYDFCFYLSESYRSVAIGIFTQNEEYNKILNGNFKSKIILDKLIDCTKGDYSFLQQLAKSAGRGTTAYISLSFANSLMYIGSTNDTFMRTNIEFFAQNKGWLKFITHSFLGGIHFANENIYSVLENILPTEKSTSDGGGLLALGLSKAGTFNRDDVSFFYNFLDAEGELDSELTYGAILGLGCSLMGSNNKKVVKDLLEILRNDDSLLGEGAAISIGQILMGSLNADTLSVLFEILKSTDKERLVRSLSIGISLIMVQQESRETLEFLNDTSDNIRYCGVLTLGASFAGTSNTEIISYLLKATADYNNEIKRLAIISIGLVCADNEELLLDILEPLALNHSPFVKSGVAIILGFFFCGQGNQKVINIVEVLMHDENPLVQQSACIGMGFLLVQMNSKIVKNYKRIVDEINNRIIYKQGDTCSRLGAFLGRSLMESGGGNVIFSVKNLCNRLDKGKISSLIIFLHYWYWFPFLPYLTLLFKPTFLFLINKNLEESDEYLVFPGKETNYEKIQIDIPDIKKKKKYVRRLKNESEIEENKIEDNNFITEGEYEKKSGTMKEKERIDGKYEDYFYFVE